MPVLQRARGSSGCGAVGSSLPWCPHNLLWLLLLAGGAETMHTVLTALHGQNQTTTLWAASGSPPLSNLRAITLKSNDAVSTNSLTARLQQSQSTRPCAVVQIEQATVPAATQWFCLRGDSPHWAFPDRMHPRQNCSPHCATDVEQWFARTQQNGTQDHAFYGTQSTISGSGARTVNTFVVEAWTARTDLGDRARARLLATSPALTFTFDDKGYSASVDMGPFSAQDGDPGESTIFAVPNRTNAAWQQVETITWSAFYFKEYDVTSNGVTRPVFAFSEGVLFETFTPRQHRTVHVNVSFSSPGVYYLGMFGVWNGVYGYTSPAPENGVNAGYYPRVEDNNCTKGACNHHTRFQPLAFVIPFENGSAPALPRGFIGPVYRSLPIPENQRLALLTHAITIFNGGSVFLRCVHDGGSSFGAAKAPRVIELELPKGITVLNSGEIGKETGLMGFNNVTDVTGVSGGGKVAPGYIRVRLDKTPTASWGIYNVLKLQFEIAVALAGRTFPLGKIRCYSTRTGQQRSDNWQSLSITVKALVPVPVLPKRLHTSYCWSNPWLFPSDNRTGGLSSLQMWRTLGFNTIPGAGSSESTSPSFNGRDNNIAGMRLPPGMKKGIATSPFRYGSLHGAPGCILALALKPDVSNQTEGTMVIPNVGTFNLSARGLSVTEAEAERIKWRAALEFHSHTGILDMAYQGWFQENDWATIADKVNASKSDYVTLDVEQFPDFESWAKVGWTSSNFAARKLKGETNSAASLRIAQSWFGGAVAAARKVRPDIKVYLYNFVASFNQGIDITQFQMGTNVGLADSPCFGGYLEQNDLAMFAMSVRREREAVKSGTEVIPWLTNGATGGTGGAQIQQPGIAMFNLLIQLFASGATGFNVYTDYGTYTMDIWLAFRDAIALVTPYEGLIMDGAPVAADKGAITVSSSASRGAVVSGMEDLETHTMLIASSITPYGDATSFSIASSYANASWRLCDLATGVSKSASASGVVEWSSEAENGSVLVLGAHTPCHNMLDKTVKPFKSDDLDEGPSFSLDTP
jgi:hypothetical protein